MDNNQFLKDITVNRMQLDNEWLAYPNKVWKYTKIHADALDKRNKYKEELSVIESELYLEAKKDPEKTIGIPANKVSEATIKSWILTQPTYKQALTNYLSASHEADILRGAVSTIEILKGTLGNMVSLWLANYYSIPKVSEGVKSPDCNTSQLSDLQDMKEELTNIRRRKKNG